MCFHEYMYQFTFILRYNCNISFFKFQGISSMSDYAIGFHYVSPTIMYLLEYVVYHLRPYGVKFADLDLNTPVK